MSANILNTHFNKAKANVINLLSTLGIDSTLIKNVEYLNKDDINKDKLNKSNFDSENIKINKFKFLEYKYTGAILEYYMNHIHTQMSDYEKRIVVYDALNTIYKTDYIKDKSIEDQDKLLRYGYLLKTSLHSFPLQLYLSGNTMESLYPSDYKEIISNLNSITINNKSNRGYNNHIANIQSLFAYDALEELLNEKNIEPNTYLVKTNYVKNKPFKANDSVTRLLKEADEKFLNSHNIDLVDGKNKLFALRELMTSIYQTNAKDIDEFNKLMCEYHREIKQLKSLYNSNVKKI